MTSTRSTWSPWGVSRGYFQVSCRVVEANRREWRRRLTVIAEALGAPKPKLLTDGLLLLVEGAYTVSQTLGGPKGPGAALTAAAKAMVDGQMRN